MSAPTQELDPTRLRIHWVIPDFGLGDGGHMAIFRIISLLEGFGHDNEVWIRSGTRWRTGEKARRMAREYFSPVRAPFRILDQEADLDSISGDLAVATDRWTAYPVRAIRRVRARAYFVQDFEPWFYPRGEDFLLTELTYRFGFYPIASSQWLGRELEKRFGTRGSHFSYGYDSDVYLPNDPAGLSDRSRREPASVAFYCRGATPRRAVLLGRLALEKVAALEPKLVVHFFGGRPTWREFPYRYHDHGILSPNELARLYRSSTVGMVFSCTNPSLVPKEMMACGLPVLELATEATAETFPAGTVRLAGPDPADIAASLAELLSDPAERRRLSQNAREFVGRFTWEQSARQIESGFLKALGL